MEKVFIDKEEISDALIERPACFSIKKKHYSVFPPSLGKIQLIARLVEKIGLGENTTYKSAYEAAQSHRDECLRLVAYSTLPGMECLDENKVIQRIEEFKVADEAELSSLVILILSFDKTDKIKRHFGMDKEAKRLSKVAKVKEKSAKGSVSFGGVSIWGSLLDAACERYGWSYQYVLWGISYTNLQLLLADQVRTVFLTEDELKNAHISTDKVHINAKDTGALEEFIITQSWK